MTAEEKAALTPEQRTKIIEEVGMATYQSARFAIRAAIDATTLTSERLLVLVVPRDSPMYRQMCELSGSEIRGANGETDVFVFAADRETFSAWCIEHTERDVTVVLTPEQEADVLAHEAKMKAESSTSGKRRGKKTIAKKDEKDEKEFVDPRGIVRPYARLGQVLTKPPPKPGNIWTAVFCGSNYTHTLIQNPPPFTREEEAIEKEARAAARVAIEADAAERSAQAAQLAGTQLVAQVAQLEASTSSSEPPSAA